MIKLYQDTKVFVPCPAGAITGGAELLHQIVHILNNNGVDAYIYYYGDNSHTIPEDYSIYNIKTTEKIDDNFKNIEILYEGLFDRINKNKSTQKILWWLSVDHFYSHSLQYLSILDIYKFNKKEGLKALAIQVKNLLKNRDKRIFTPLTLKTLRDSKAVHGYQSEYAQNYLQNRGFKELVALKDYINDEHSFSSDLLINKENIILYNPKKGYKFTKKIIEMAPHLNWIPLQNMTRTELIKTIKKAKIYIDFGYHPGKDRLPRECAMNGCCIITSTQGSAGFFEDVAIPEEYKFENKTSNIAKIIFTIEKTLKDYSSAINDFQFYRNQISREKQEFESQVLNLFNISLP